MLLVVYAVVLGLKWVVLPCLRCFWDYCVFVVVCLFSLVVGACVRLL